MLIAILRIFAMICIAVICGKLVAKIKLPAIKRGEIRKQAKTLISSRFKDSGQTGYK